MRRQNNRQLKTYYQYFFFKKTNRSRCATTFIYYCSMTVTSNICEAYLINDYVIFFINLYLNVGTPNALFI